MTNVMFACFYFNDRIDLGSIAQKSFRYSSQIYLLPPHAVVVEFGKSHRILSESEFFENVRTSFSDHSNSLQIGRAEHALFSYIFAKYACADIFSAPLKALIDLMDPLLERDSDRKKVAKLVSTLMKGQITTIRHFHELPRHQIPSRFGPEGLRLKSRILGEFLPTFPLVKQIENFKAREDLTSSYGAALAGMIEVIERLLKSEIFPPLRKLGGKLEILEISFGFEKNSLHVDERRQFSVKFVEPQVRVEDTISIIWTCVETSLQRKPIHYSTPILYIEVEATKWLIDTDEQTGFFDEAERRKEKEYIVQTRHKNRYGDENIFRPELTEDRRPEFSWRKILDPKAIPKTLDIRGKIPLRPVMRLPSPHLIHVARDRQSLRKGNQAPLEIARWEPMTELLQSHWFDNESGELINNYDRKYYRVHLTIGRELSIFQGPDNRWYLDGYSA